ncbi:ADP-ribosylglycohydrolase family protein [Herpetosiphon geysericola]|uniref:ADP-ribosylglycohydrolase n=1 Tax=Herpetosiphon geysericola TaxID=70996 RepID=A0A0P6XEA9_9CHLR|nr:ADP-ribosylglycohydrolase family protein [Herpetosiphon geysericola]KPL81385.1 ADP-ribosylglycohydrolase [Herpetosiphon geysericola]
MLERYRGCLLGLAVGDAVGTTVEFSPPGSFKPLTDMVGGGPFNLPLGAWTDDTSMALCLAASLIERQGFDAVDQMQRYCRWRDYGYMSSTGSCFDCGITVGKALSSFQRTGEPYSGSTDPATAGNGSLMRLAPVVLAYASQPEQAMQMAVDSSRTTHGALAALDACRYFAGLLIGALNGVDKVTLLAPHYSPIANYWQQQPLQADIAEIAAGSFWQRQPPEIQGTGYVVRSLEAALWAFANSDSFREGCLMAANLGHDADTTAAIYGQIAGAYYGEAGIPAEWRKPIVSHDLIVEFAERLYRLSH